MAKHIFLVQTGKGKGSYQTQYSFTVNGMHSSQAWLYYSSINSHSGYKKRILCDGKVIHRVIT